MIAEPVKFLAKQVPPHQNILRELSPSTRSEMQILGDTGTTIIIDYGSETIKAGYESGEQQPALVFRSQLAKNKDISKPDCSIKSSINTRYDQLQFSRSNFKSPFERNIILHFSLIQQCNDYIFSELIKPNKRIKSTLIVSEPFANPIHCRNSMLEQFFQCYQINQVVIGVDALYAYYYEMDCSMAKFKSETNMVVYFGANTTHIFAVVNGQTVFESVRRINVGGNNSFELFSKTILLKNPHLRNKLTYSFMRDLYENFTEVVLEYKEQLKHFESKFKPKRDQRIYRNQIQEQNKLYLDHIHLIDGIEIDFDAVIQVPEEELKRKAQVRKRMSQKLRETISRRKQIKRKQQELQLKNYQELKEKYEAHDKFAHEEVVEMFGQHKAFDRLVNKIKELEVKLGLVEEKNDQKKFALIDIPDDELPPERIKYKRMQIYQKKALEERRRKKAQKELEDAKLQEIRENNPEQYLHELRDKYNKLSTKAKQAQRIRKELANRKSKLKQRKMQAIARLVEEEDDQNFGNNQDDWLACKDANDSDHFSQLEAMETELRQIDPEWSSHQDIHHLKETNQIFLETELIKCHQIYFQPKIIGVQQADVIETIISIISMFDKPIQAKLLSSILLIGGGSNVKGLVGRFERSLRKQAPCQMNVGVRVGRGGHLGAYLGMQQIAKQPKEYIEQISFKRKDYINSGTLRFVANPWSNPVPNI